MEHWTSAGEGICVGVLEQLRKEFEQTSTVEDFGWQQVGCLHQCRNVSREVWGEVCSIGGSSAGVGRKTCKYTIGLRL